MHTSVRKALGLGLIAVVSAVGLVSPAWSADRREWRRGEAERREGPWRGAAERREGERRRGLERERAAAYWRFERNRGWRFEHRPGAWSPYYVWWWTGGQVVMRPMPTARVVTYPNGRYVLMGDGVTAPYYWVWQPAVMVGGPPPPPFVPAPPLGVPTLPPDALMPPPPPPPAG